MTIDYKAIKFLDLECSCVSIKQWKWDELMEGHVRANKREINRLVKEHLPDLYEGLALNYYNPYDYYRTSTHLVLVHSSVEYFIKFEVS